MPSFTPCTGTASKNREGGGKADYSDYELVWHDEFDKDGRPDPAKWNYEHGFVRNKEEQWYQPENARCEDGMLIIEGKKEKHANPHYDPAGKNWQTTRKEADYTSASLTTRGKFSWLYGRFEIRARFSPREGMWPAFWTMGVKEGWPMCGEIDIMEYYQSTYLANLCWASPKNTWANGALPTRRSNGSRKGMRTGRTASMSSAWTGMKRKCACMRTTSC